MPDDLDTQADIKEELITSEAINDEETFNGGHKEMCQKSQQLNLNNNNFLMLRDTTLDVLPSNLKQLFENFQPESMTIADACYQLCYLVALETGFAELNVYHACADELCNNHIVTSYYEAKNVCQLTQFKPIMERSESGLYFSMQLCSIVHEECLEAAGLDETALLTLLSAIVTGDFMIVSLTPMQRRRPGSFNSPRSICLSMPRYVISTMTSQNKKTLNDCLRNMEELTRKLRDELFVPLRCVHLQLLDVDIYPALEALPLEVYNVILEHLDEKHLKVLAKVNKQFFELISNRDNKFQSATSSMHTADLPHMMSSYFEMEPYYQLA